MEAKTQTVTFTPGIFPETPKAHSVTPLTPEFHGPVFHGTGLIEPYNPDTEQLQMTMQRNLEADLQRRIDLFEDHKKKYLERSNRFYHKQLEVEERHKSLDDRLFKILNEATSQMLNTRYLDNREKQAYEILTEPIDDLTHEEENVKKLEAVVELIYKKLDNDKNDEIEQQLEQDEKDCEELILLNSRRNNDIALRQSRLQQEKLFIPLNNPHYQKNSGIFNPSLPEQKEMTTSLQDSMDNYQKTTEHLKKINQEMDDINKLEIENRENQRKSEVSYEEKLKKIQDLLVQVEEVEKYESFVSELESAVTSLRFDHYDNIFKIRNLGLELAAQGYDVSNLKNIDLSDLNVNISVFEPVSELKKRVQEKQAKIDLVDQKLNKRKEEHEKNVKIVYEASQAEKARAAKFDELKQELVKVCTDAEAKNDLANDLADKIFGERTVSITGTDFQTKINQIKQNLALLKEVVVDDEDEDETPNDNQNKKDEDSDDGY